MVREKTEARNRLLSTSDELERTSEVMRRQHVSCENSIISLSRQQHDDSLTPPLPELALFISLMVEIYSDVTRIDNDDIAFYELL